MNDLSRHDGRSMVWFAVQFEFGLAGAALLLGWLSGFWPRWVLVADDPPWPRFAVALAAGLVVGGLLALLLKVCEHLRWRPIRRLRNLVTRKLVPLFAGARWYDLLLISLAAGVGEELLFRAWLQAGLAAWIQSPTGQVLSLVVASVVFGACHWITHTYFVLATLIGVLMGLLYVLSGHLIAPIAAHALYDFLALKMLLKEQAMLKK